jgi:hypothetical protein
MGSYHQASYDSFELQGEVPETLMISQTADISALLAAEIVHFFDWVWWYDEPASFPDEKQKIGRYLGPSHNHGSEMHVLEDLKGY